MKSLRFSETRLGFRAVKFEKMNSHLTWIVLTRYVGPVHNKPWAWFSEEICVLHPLPILYTPAHKPFKCLKHPHLIFLGKPWAVYFGFFYKKKVTFYYFSSVFKKYILLKKHFKLQNKKLFLVAFTKFIFSKNKWFLEKHLLSSQN